FFSSLSAEHLQRYFRIIQEGIAVRRHFDLLRWLQGEIQHYLPHEIMLAAWGDARSGFTHYDIVSALPGVRTAYLEPAGLSPLLRELYNRWVELGRMPVASGMRESGMGESCMLRTGSGLQCSFGKALQGMHSSLLHGISDKRGHHDCLYVIFSSSEGFNHSTLSAMEVLLPYLDNALRRVAPLPCHQAPRLCDSPDGEDFGLSERESEIMDWVRMGKTNAEIGSILCISSYTVKNHLHQIFRKLDVYNRMQAVSKIERGASHG
ncbi:XrtB/PEP-CTERM-associated transcriptional regulator EpsA, partial [Nitrosovibrio tenuis]